MTLPGATWICGQEKLDGLGVVGKCNGTIYILTKTLSKGNHTLSLSIINPSSTSTLSI